MHTLAVIVDMQFGSCGKGLLAGYLAHKLKPDALITAWAPNAGHTFIDAAGVKMVNIAMPNGMVSPSVTRIFIGPGSIINPEIMLSEMERYKSMLNGVRILIHENAAVVAERHREAEAATMFKIGSTMKGCGEALIEKIKRAPGSNITARDALRNTELAQYVVPAHTYDDEMDRVRIGLVEGAQGFGLSLNQGTWPYTTSRDCTVNQLLSDCSIPANARMSLQTYGVCRTFPIRVSNRYNKDGVQIGSSGPCLPDQQEIPWSTIGREPELTTVTRLPRRLFTFSAEQVRSAMRMNGIDTVFLNFVNYLKDLDGGKQEFRRIVAAIEECGQDAATIGWLGVGPQVTDIIEVKSDGPTWPW